MRNRIDDNNGVALAPKDTRQSAHLMDIRVALLTVVDARLPGRWWLASGKYGDKQDSTPVNDTQRLCV